MVGFILLLLLFIGIWVGMIGMADVQEINKNWPKYRCRPNIMPFASLYGHNTAENFQFCLSNMFGAEMGTALGPIFTILGSIISTLVALIQVANSIRVQFATMMGGVNTVFQNFSDRFKQLLAAVKMSAYRMKLLMGRLYGAFFAMIYMSIAGMTSMQNFTDSVLFDFIDSFCFDPDTLVEIQDKGFVKVKDVKMGDRFAKTGGRVTSTFQFEADGQAMVELPGDIVVSTNHYVNYLGKWLQAGSHPQAIKKPVWNGGKERPLICFNTSDHKIPIGNFLFLDYDETEEGDKDTMEWIEERLNGKKSKLLKERNYEYSSCVGKNTMICMADGSQKPIQSISLGEQVSTGRVIGVISKESATSCQTPLGDTVAPGLLYWETNQWVRAGDVCEEVYLETPQTFYSLVVLKCGTFETGNGLFMRDYVEVHSPEGEQFYTKKIESSSLGELLIY